MIALKQIIVDTNENKYKVKKFVVLLFVACFSTLTYADSLIDYQFQIREFRWGNSRYDLLKT